MKKAIFEIGTELLLRAYCNLQQKLAALEYLCYNHLKYCG